jgi:hypothetical protein
MTALVTERMLELLEIVSRKDSGLNDGGIDRVVELMEELAPDPQHAITLAVSIVNATAVVLRRLWEKHGLIEDGDMAGLMPAPGGSPSPASWRAGQMLTAAFNGDLDDATDHAIVAARIDEDMQDLMGAVLLQWHAIARAGAAA